MAKRKRDPHKADGGRQKSKRRRTVSSNFSEAPDNDDVMNFERVRVPPPKSAMQTTEYLTFPMGQSSRPLPDCEGPKLQPFLDGDVPVRFIKELGTNAIHSNVFEVEINGERYALKVFRTFDARWFPDRECWPPGSYPGPKDMANYFRPFNQECRAYGCINESKVSHRYWRCYGYLKLPSHLRDELCRITGFPHHYWQFRPPEFGRTDKPTTTNPHQLSWPIYAVVKELAPYPSAEIDPKQRSIRSMLTDLRELHKIGVINTDIADRNYLVGRIIDFSLALTLPHLWFDRLEGARETFYPHNFKYGANRDMLSLRCMIRDSGIKTKSVYQPIREDGSVFTRTRARRARRKQEPFYELGVNEPTPPRPRCTSSTSSNST